MLILSISMIVYDIALFRHVLKMGIKKPVEHFTVPQVNNHPAANEGPAPRTFYKFIACSVCTVDLYAVQRDPFNCTI